MKSPGLILAIAIFLALNITAQETPPKLSLNESSIENQFKYVYQKSSDYEEFKMVKRWYFNQLKNHVLDTIQLVENELLASRELVSSKINSIDSLISLNGELRANLANIEKEKDSMVLLGISLQKTAYNSIVWLFIVLLSATLFIFVVLFRRSNHLTIENKNALQEVKDEFEAFRKRALEREENVARRYHDELQKYKSKLPQTK